MIEAGTPAPDFTLPSLDGSGAVRLGDAAASGPVLVAFFKVSCPTCQLAMPYWSRLAAAGRGLRIIGVSQDDAGLARQFNARFGVNLETLIDDASGGYTASNRYGLTHVPSQFLVESDGRISRAWSGFDRKEIEEVGARMGAVAFAPGDPAPLFKAG